MRRIGSWLVGGLAVASLMGAAEAPARAATMKECSAKYKAAKADGSLGGLNWKSFRAKECTSITKADATPGTSATTASAPATLSKSATPASTGKATFPTAINPKYAKETAGKGRMHTCLDQYHANKESGGNGGLRWIQKGGGYYSECSKRLKG